MTSVISGTGRDLTRGKILCMEKVCTRCKGRKPLEAFAKNRNESDGRQSQCRECAKSYFAGRNFAPDYALENGTKRCGKCHATKPRTEFYRHRVRPDGLRCECKSCTSTYNRRLVVKERNLKFHATPRSRGLEKKRRGDLEPRFRAAIRWCAGKRGHEWTLTLEQYTELASKACAYCGGPLPKYGSGLDRTDNAKGYTPENVVPCCELCNRVKMHVFTYNEMLRLGALIREIMAERRDRVA